MKWKARAINIDIETGEQITKNQKEKEYDTLKTIKNYIINENNTSGIIEYTNECRKKQQTEFEFGTNA